MNSIYTINELVFVVQDAPVKTRQGGDSDEAPERKSKILEQYYNDIYKLFLGKLAKFDSEPLASEAEQRKLRQLLDEIISIKTLLMEVS